MPSYSGLWNNEYGENYALLTNRANNNRTTLARVFANRLYSRAVDRELLQALIGAAAGSNATSSHKRVKAVADTDDNVQGGVRTIETFEGVNRNTTAADVTYFNNALDQNPKPTYPGDASGNGGGGKLGV